MPQSGVIVAALMAGFLVYLAIKGRLGVYWNLFVGGAGTGTGTGLSPSSTASSNVGPSTPGGNIFGTSRTPLYLPSWLGGGAIPGTYSTMGNPAPGMSPQTQTGDPSTSAGPAIPPGQTYAVSPPASASPGGAP